MYRPTFRRNSLRRLVLGFIDAILFFCDQILSGMTDQRWNEGSSALESARRDLSDWIRWVFFLHLSKLKISTFVCVLKKFGVCIRISVRMFHQFDGCVFFLIFILLTEVNVVFLRLCNCQQNYVNCELRWQ